MSWIEVLAQVFAQLPGEFLAAHERGVADDGVEAAVAHDFGELQGPMQGADGLGAGSLEPGVEPGAECAFER